MTGTREGRPLCDEIVTPDGGRCDYTVYQDGKCALHANAAALKRREPSGRRGRRDHQPGKRDPEHGVVVPAATGMEAVWESCRRWDRLYDATLRRHDDREGRAT